MSKVIAFFGSPREDGLTAKLIRQMIAGAKSEGAEVVSYDLNDDGVKGCQGCYFCRQNVGCAVKDKLQHMYGDIKNADGIIAGFPIYFYDVGGQSKILIDRLFPMIDGGFVPRYPGKKIATVYAQGNGDRDAYSSAIDKTDKVFVDAFGWSLVESFLVCSDKDVEGLMGKAFEVGRMLLK